MAGLNPSHPTSGLTSSQRRALERGVSGLKKDLDGLCKNGAAVAGLHSFSGAEALADAPGP